MSNENKEKAMLADDLSQYIREKHNQDECVGFSDGYKLALKKLKLMAVSSNVSNSLVADIRNKLTPINNLCVMLRNAPRNLTDDGDINNIIFSEIAQCEKSIKYLSNL